MGHRAAEVAVGRQAVGEVLAGEVLAGPKLEAAVHEGEVAGPRVVGVAPTVAVGPTRAALRGEGVVVVGEVAEEALRARRRCPG